MDDTPGRHVLITGASSFAGRRMLMTLLDREPESHVYAVIPEHLIERVRSALGAEAGWPPGLTVLIGDTAALDLGLSGEEWQSLTEKLTDIYHMASIFYLGVDYDEAYHVNVKGTQNALRLASECRQLDRFNHFSTAFVSGNRTGVIMEDELASGQSFRSPFERTKYEAELALESWSSRLSITVFRPSLIVGDSRTGVIDRNRMEGPYMLMKAIVGAPAEVPIPLPGKGEKPLNLVPIDWVCEAMYALSRHPEARGRTFHLTDPNPLSARKIFELVARHARRRPPKGRVPFHLARLVTRLPYLERLLRRHRQFLEDFNHLAIYNSMSTMALLEETPCPAFPSYVEPLVRYMQDEG